MHQDKHARGQKRKKRDFSPVRGEDEKSLEAGRKPTLVDKFFSDVISHFSDDKNADQLLSNNSKVKFVLVNHLVPTLFPFLRAIKKVGDIAAIIPKASSPDEAVEKEVKELYKDTYVVCPPDNEKRWDDYLAKNNNAVQFLKTKLHDDTSKFLIIDIGGYFARPLFKILEAFQGRILGVVEDTENGHQAYEKIIKGKILPRPIISVARSKLKNTEDYNVGKSIVEATDAILRTEAHTMLERMKKVGILGFGKIGRSIAEHLRQKHIQEVVVYDTDVIRQMEAASLGFKVVARQVLLENSATIFCATGMRSLEGDDFKLLRDNVFIASCTSSDKEFDLSYLKKQKNFNKQEYISKYYLDSDNNRVNLINEGCSVNFVYGAVNGPYIYSVQAGLIVAAINLINRVVSCDNIQELTNEEMTGIAMDWLSHFEGYDISENFHINNPKFVAGLNDYYKVSGSIDHNIYLTLIIDLLKYVNQLEMSAHYENIIHFLYNAVKGVVNQSNKTPDEWSLKEGFIRTEAERCKVNITIWKNETEKANSIIEAISSCCKLKFYDFALHIVLLFHQKLLMLQDGQLKSRYDEAVSCLKKAGNIYAEKLHSEGIIVNPTLQEQENISSPSSR